MSRISSANPDSTPPEIASALSQLPHLDVYGLMASSPGTFLPWLAMGDALAHDLALRPSLRELVILQIGRLTHPYPWEQHISLARHFGVTDEQIEGIEHDNRVSTFDQKERAVLRFTVAFVRDGIITDDAYTVLTGLLSQREIVEMAFVAGQYLGLTRMMTAFGIESNPPIGPSGLRASENIVRHHA